MGTGLNKTVTQVNTVLEFSDALRGYAGYEGFWSPWLSNQTLKELLFYISLCYSTPGSFLKTSGEVLNNILYKMLN